MYTVMLPTPGNGGDIVVNLSHFVALVGIPQDEASDLYLAHKAEPVRIALTPHEFYARYVTRTMPDDR